MVISDTITLESLARSPWKNGGGSTRTLAVEPPAGDLDHFLWRISLADVTAPGSFSHFDGVDRTILLWSGEGLVLRSPVWSHTLDQPCVPFHFRGEEKIDSSLVGGATMDLNVMVRRGAAEAIVRVEFEPMKVIEPVATMIILCAAGSVEVRSEASVRLLEADEFLRIDDCEVGTTLSPSMGEAKFIAISLTCL